VSIVTELLCLQVGSFQNGWGTHRQRTVTEDWDSDFSPDGSALHAQAHQTSGRPVSAMDDIRAQPCQSHCPAPLRLESFPRKL